MINLLPPQEQRELLLGNQKKLVVILGITVLIPLSCFALILLSINFSVLGEIPQEKIALQQIEKQYQTPDFLHFKDIIQENNKTVTALRSFYKDQIYMGSILKTVSLIPRPQNVYLTGLSLMRAENKKVKISISGFSKSREDLLSFQKNIQDVETIENLYFSPESWINPVDLNFNLTFEIS